MKSLSLGTLGLVLTVSTVSAAEPKLFDVEVIRNVAYYDGKDADDVRHRLDLYLPKGQKDYPVLLMVHGGAWIKGDKNHLGVYNLLGRSFARHGIGMVSPNYRLSPGVQHPEHIRDVARAFAWVHKNIATQGGNPRELFVAGHSAGGHLVSLLSTDETYLKAHGLCLADIKGAMPISGVYAIPKDPVFDLAFGKDPAIRQQASPLTRACAAAPPFLLLYANSELPGCEGPCAEAFCRALKGKQCLAQTFECAPRNHLSILANAAASDTDPVFRSMLSFITAQTALERMCGPGADGIACLQRCIARYAANCGDGR